MMATMILLSSPFFYCVCCRCHCGSSGTVPSASGLYPEVATQRVLNDVSRARDAERNVLKNHRHPIALTGVFVSAVLFPESYEIHILWGHWIRNTLLRGQTLEDSLSDEGGGDTRGRSTIGVPLASRPWIPYPRFPYPMPPP